jgi:hypothetical protein
MKININNVNGVMAKWRNGEKWHQLINGEIIIISA